MRKKDLNYIESEEEHIALVKPALQDEFDNSFEVGFKEGFKKGKMEAKEQVILLSYEEDLPIPLITKITQLTENEVTTILKKYAKL